MPAAVRVAIATELVERIGQLSARIAQIERRIADLVADRAPALFELPGRGPLTATKLLGEIAGVKRFSSSATLARSAGVAPLPASSGNRQGHRLDRGGNRQRNCALHWLAVNQGRLHGSAREYLKRHRSAGDGRMEALCRLERHLPNVVSRSLRGSNATPSPKEGLTTLTPSLT
jgi:transposase